MSGLIDFLSSPAGIVAVISLLVGIGTGFYRVWRAKRQIRGAFGKYVSPEIVKELEEKDTGLDQHAGEPAPKAPRPSPAPTAEAPSAPRHYGLSMDSAMRVLVPILVLGASLYVILSGSYDAETQKWAFGTTGMIAGAWLPISK